MSDRFDAKTLVAYAQHAASYSQDWLDQPPPSDLYALLERYLVAGGETADIGCGNGRDTAWLAAHGYPVIGYDGSDALLAEACRLNPGLEFRRAMLPELAEIEQNFDNIVCETVIMHLPAATIPLALQGLLGRLRPGGVLYLSWRVTTGSDLRHDDGRLYAAFEPALVLDALAGCSILHFDDVISASSGKRICRVIAAKQHAAS